MGLKRLNPNSVIYAGSRGRNSFRIGDDSFLFTAFSPFGAEHAFIAFWCRHIALTEADFPLRD
jgi:hypothetical protein